MRRSKRTNETSPHFVTPISEAKENERQRFEFPSRNRFPRRNQLAAEAFFFFFRLGWSSFPRPLFRGIRSIADISVT